MSYRTISTIVHDTQHPLGAMEAAINISRDLAAHLSVLAVGIDVTEPSFYYAGAEAVTMADNLERARESANELKEAADTRLSKADIAWDVQHVTLQLSAFNSYIGNNTRFSDLVVLPKPYGPERNTQDQTIAEAALFSAGCPVLFIPESGQAPKPGGRVLLAWNNGDEALAAAQAAMPYLHAASLVEIIIIDPPQHAPDRSDPGGALAQYLSRHGVTCEIAVLAKTEPRICDILLHRANEMGCDLIVMGAYGHSRMREAIFGGATRTMMEKTNVPVLMSR
ncbi:MAG: universal stress protein [Litoreibacter sp.]|nr:universal stress protein [Litoreibacter sp.]